MSVKSPRFKFTYESSSSSEEEAEPEFDYKGLSSMFAPVPKFQYPVMKFEKMVFDKNEEEPWKEITGNILNKFAPKQQSEKSPNSLILSGGSLNNLGSPDLDRRGSIMSSLNNLRNKTNEGIIKSFKRFKRLKVEQKEEISPLMRTLQRKPTKMTLIMEQQSSHKPRSYKKLRQQQVNDVLLGKYSEYYHKMIVLPKHNALKSKRRHSYEDMRNQSDHLLRSMVVDDHAIVTDYLNTQAVNTDDNNSSMTSITSRDLPDASPPLKNKRKPSKPEKRSTIEAKNEKKIPVPLGRRKSDATEYSKKTKDKLSRANVILLNSDISTFFRNKGSAQEENLKTIVIKAPRKGKSNSLVHHPFKRFTITNGNNLDKQRKSSNEGTQAKTLNLNPTAPSKSNLKGDGSKNSFGDRSSQSRLSVKMSSDCIDEIENQLASPIDGSPRAKPALKMGRKDSKSRTLAVPSKTSLDQIPSLDLDRLKKNEEMRESLEDISHCSSKILASSSNTGSKHFELRKSALSGDPKKHIETISQVAKLSYKERRLLLKSDITQMTRILNSQPVPFLPRKESETTSIAANTITGTITVSGSSPNRPSKVGKKPLNSEITSTRIKSVYMLGKKTSMGSFIPPLNMDILGTSGTNGTTTPNASTKNYKVETGSSPKTVSNKSSNLVRIKTIKGSITHRGSSSFKFPEDSPDRINHKLSLTPNTPKTDGPKFVYQMKQAVSKGSALSPKKTLSTSSSVASKDFLNPGNVEVQPKKPNPPNTRKGSKV